MLRVGRQLFPALTREIQESKGKATMAASLHQTIYEVKGEVKLQASNTISRTSVFQAGLLRLSQLGDTFFIECVYDNGKPNKRYKVCRACCHCHLSQTHCHMCALCLFRRVFIH